MISNLKKTAILFSGGSDSTLAVILEQEKFDVIYLLSFFRQGITSIENTAKHAEALRSKYPNKTFIHKIISIEKTFKKISYHNYIKNLFTHRLFMLSTCGFCKLAMHIETIKFCKEENIHYVSDGAHQSMEWEPFQRQDLIQELAKLYQSYKITYNTPVFHIPEKPEPSFFELKLAPILEVKEEKHQEESISSLLYKNGITPKAGIRGSFYDKKHQANCQQLLLFRLFAIGFYIPTFGMNQYVRGINKLFREKILLAKENINCPTSVGMKEVKN